MNHTRTPKECVATVFHHIDQLLEAGVCETCALKATCHRFDITYSRLLVLYLNRESF